MQHDAMDDAPTSGAYVAEAVAAAAALFHAPSGDLAERIPGAEHLLPVRVAALSGGLPVRVGGRSWRVSASVDRRRSGAPSSRPPYWRSAR